MLRYAANVARTVVGFTAIALATLVAGPTAWLAGKLDRPHIADWAGDKWARLVLFVAGVSYTIEGRDHLSPGTSYVVVSNHLSNLDAMMHFIAMQGYSLRFMAKKEVYRVPVIGWAIDAMGMVKVDRARPGFDYINAQVARIFAKGWSVMVYAEGTRARSDSIRAFKKGPFVLAITSQQPVLPVAIHGTGQAWRPGHWMLKGGSARLVIHEPIATTGLNLEDEEQLRMKVESIIAATYDRLKGESSQS